MAELRTLKGGRLYLLVDGSSCGDFAQANVSSGCFFEKTDNTWAALIEEGGDLYQYNGDTPASIQAATPSASINETNAASKPVVYLAGSRQHLWYATDEGSSAFDLRYRFSDNDGTSWSAAVDLDIAGDQTWCNDAIWPLYFDFEADGTDQHRLWCVGQNSSTYTLGYVAIDTSAASFVARIGLAVNYTAQASGVSYAPSALGIDQALTKHNGLYYRYARISSTEIALSTSSDGDSFTPNQVVLSSGVTGTKDDSVVRPYHVAIHQGVFHILYGGNAGSNVSPRLAVGESPDQLRKVPYVDVATFGSADLLVSYAADLTADFSDLTQHTSNRGHPGGLTEGPFAPVPLSFTARVAGELSGSSSTLRWLADGGIYPPVGTDANKDVDVGALRITVCYITEDTSGDPSEYYLFPDCTFSVNVTEGDDVVTINASGQMHSMRRPLFGSIS